MAFISPAPLLSRPATVVARTRPTMSAEPSPAVSATPLNADSAHPMKEPYKLAAGKIAPVCRCWQSKKFPLCDGSHNAFNKATGSNVGPLVVSAPKPE